jgi:glycosyltransferase involved in cell wall biosynthesis
LPANTRLKILEALAGGCPIVSTSVGCEGTDVMHGENILIADTPSEFAQAVVRGLSDPELQGRLGVRGRALVERQSRGDAIDRALSGLYTELLDARAEAGVRQQSWPRRIGRSPGTGQAETRVNL